MLTLLTTTGARPDAWKLCQRWMERQTYTGAVRWIIVDDGEQPQEIDFNRKWELKVIRPEPLWKPGDNTQARNIQAGLELVAADDRLVIIEDDDWYAADWLEWVDLQLDKADLVGEGCAKYYNVQQKRWKDHQNKTHSSLCSTAMKGKAIDTFRSVARPKIQFIDVLLWQAFSPNRVVVENKSRVIGIKGMPGRIGIGYGHGKNFNGKPDFNGSQLRKWIGNDADFYFGKQIGEQDEAAETIKPDTE